MIKSTAALDAVAAAPPAAGTFMKSPTNDAIDQALDGVDVSGLSEEFDRLLNSYYASKVDRYMPAPVGTRSFGSGADYHYRYETELMRMIERARLADRDNMVVGQGINRMVANIFQCGFKYDPETGDDDVDQAKREWWHNWSTDADAVDMEGERTFHEFETAGFRHMIVDGDGVFLPINTGPGIGGGPLQYFEAHRLRNPFGFRKMTPSDMNLFCHGVELDRNNKRKAYWLTIDEIEPAAAVRRNNKSVDYPARDPVTGDRNVFHIYSPRRISQRRGVTALAPCILPMNYHDDLQFGAMVKAKVASFYAIIREREAAAPTGQGGPGQRGNQTSTTLADGTTQLNQGGSPGQEIEGRRGEKVKGFSPNIPNPEFFPHASMLLSFLAINLDLPMLVFMLDATQSNFSAWRGAIQQSRLRLGAMGREYTCKFHRPCEHWQTRRLIADSPMMRRKVKAGVDVFRHRWIPKPHEYIEPAKDAAAVDLRLATNQAAYRDVASETGRELKDLVEAVVDDRLAFAVRAKAKSDEFNSGLDKDDPERMSWRELAYGHTPRVDLTQAVVQAEAGGDKPNQSGSEGGSGET